MERKKVTLVVGDSADDIPMMEEADLNMFVTPADSDDDKVSSEYTASYAKYIADFVAEGKMIIFFYEKPIYL